MNETTDATNENTAGTDPRPPAETNRVLALSHNNDLLIYVSGFAVGVDGRIVVKLLPIKIFPPAFAAVMEPGNTGITGIGFDRVPVSAAYSFPDKGNLDEIFFEDSQGRRLIPVLKVEAGEQDLSSEKGDTPVPAPYGSENNEVEAGEWSARQDFRTPPSTVRVNGMPVMPTPGYKLTLTRAVPQGINPRILILNLESEPPSGIVIQVLTPTPVSYEEQSEQEYDSVTIEPDGIHVPVEKVQ